MPTTPPNRVRLARRWRHRHKAEGRCQRRRPASLGWQGQRKESRSARRSHAGVGLRQTSWRARLTSAFCGGSGPSVITTCSAAITVCGKSVSWRRALELFEEMVSQGLAPDVIVYSAAIGAPGLGPRALGPGPGPLCVRVVQHPNKDCRRMCSSSGGEKIRSQARTHGLLL